MRETAAALSLRRGPCAPPNAFREVATALLQHSVHESQLRLVSMAEARTEPEPPAVLETEAAATDTPDDWAVVAAVSRANEVAIASWMEALTGIRAPSPAPPLPPHGPTAEVHAALLARVEALAVRTRVCFAMLSL